MGLATLNGVPFRLDPQSITWSYTIHANEAQTVGGKVVQVLGATIDNMVIHGSFGVGGWEEQQRFLQRMIAIADQQVVDAHVRNSNNPVMRFLYPPRKWDFLVYLKAFSEPGGSSSVRLTPGNFAPEWELTLFVLEDNAGLKQIAKDAFIDRLANGIGWKQTLYNGPLSPGDVQGAASASQTDIEQFLTNIYNVPANTTGQ